MKNLIFAFSLIFGIHLTSLGAEEQFELHFDTPNTLGEPQGIVNLTDHIAATFRVSPPTNIIIPKDLKRPRIFFTGAFEAYEILYVDAANNVYFQNHSSAGTTFYWLNASNLKFDVSQNLIHGAIDFSTNTTEIDLPKTLGGCERRGDHEWVTYKNSANETVLICGNRTGSGLFKLKFLNGVPEVTEMALPTDRNGRKMSYFRDCFQSNLGKSVCSFSRLDDMNVYFVFERGAFRYIGERDELYGSCKGSEKNINIARGHLLTETRQDNPRPSICDLQTGNVIANLPQIESIGASWLLDNYVAVRSNLPPPYIPNVSVYTIDGKFVVDNKQGRILHLSQKANIYRLSQGNAEIVNLKTGELKQAEAPHGKWQAVPDGDVVYWIGMSGKSTNSGFLLQVFFSHISE